MATRGEKGNVEGASVDTLDIDIVLWVCVLNSGSPNHGGNIDMNVCNNFMIRELWAISAKLLQCSNCKHIPFHLNIGHIIGFRNSNL